MRHGIDMVKMVYKNNTQIYNINTLQILGEIILQNFFKTKVKVTTGKTLYKIEEKILILLKKRI